MKGKSQKHLMIATTERWDDIADVAEQNFQRINTECLRLSKEFMRDIVPHLTYDPSWEVVLQDPKFFRVINPLFQPHAVSGSLADGARMNVGGSQNGPFRIKELGDRAQKKGALYLSDSWKTAVWETFGGDASIAFAVKQLKSHSNKKVHQFSPVNDGDIVVIDFEKACTALQPSFRLDTFFAITGDMNGQWPDLKSPAPIQLFAAWLMHESSGRARGIRFVSTVDPHKGYNYALYFLDDHAASNFFQSAELVLP